MKFIKKRLKGYFVDKKIMETKMNFMIEGTNYREALKLKELGLPQKKTEFESTLYIRPNGDVFRMSNSDFYRIHHCSYNDQIQPRFFTQQDLIDLLGLRQYLRLEIKTCFRDGSRGFILKYRHVKDGKKISVNFECKTILNCLVELICFINQNQREEK